MDQQEQDTPQQPAKYPSAENQHMSLVYFAEACRIAAGLIFTGAIVVFVSALIIVSFFGHLTAEYVIEQTADSVTMGVITWTSIGLYMIYSSIVMVVAGFLMLVAGSAVDAFIELARDTFRLRELSSRIVDNQAEMIELLRK